MPESLWLAVRTLHNKSSTFRTEPSNRFEGARLSYPDISPDLPGTTFLVWTYRRFLHIYATMSLLQVSGISLVVSFISGFLISFILEEKTFNSGLIFYEKE